MIENQQHLIYIVLKHLKSISNTLIKTFTVDRGKEFAGYNRN